jgi:nitrogen fixation protein NifX
MRRLQLIDTDAAEEPAEIPGGLKIAFATQDRRRVDAHFGSAKSLMIYEVGADACRFLEAVQFDAVSDETGDHDDGDDRLSAKVAAVNGCAMLFVLAIGGVAAARVVNNRVHPVKVTAPEAISDVIERVQTMLRGSPPPWMRKLMNQGRQRDYDFLDDEDRR